MQRVARPPLAITTSDSSSRWKRKGWQKLWWFSGKRQRTDVYPGGVAPSAAILFFLSRRWNDARDWSVLFTAMQSIDDRYREYYDCHCCLLVSKTKSNTAEFTVSLNNLVTAKSQSGCSDSSDERSNGILPRWCWKSEKPPKLNITTHRAPWRFIYEHAKPMEILPVAPDADYTRASRFYET